MKNYLFALLGLFVLTLTVPKAFAFEDSSPPNEFVVSDRYDQEKVYSIEYIDTSQCDVEQTKPLFKAAIEQPKEKYSRVYGYRWHEDPGNYKFIANTNIQYQLPNKLLHK